MNSEQVPSQWRIPTATREPERPHFDCWASYEVGAAINMTLAAIVMRYCNAETDQQPRCAMFQESAWMDLPSQRVGGALKSAKS